MRSPGCRLQPFELWWATICAALQYMAASADPRERTCGAWPAERILSVVSVTSNWMPSAPQARSAAWTGEGLGWGPASGGRGDGLRCGSRAGGHPHVRATEVRKVVARHG